MIDIENIKSEKIFFYEISQRMLQHNQMLFNEEILAEALNEIIWLNMDPGLWCIDKSNGKIEFKKFLISGKCLKTIIEMDKLQEFINTFKKVRPNLQKELESLKEFYFDIKPRFSLRVRIDIYLKDLSSIDKLLDKLNLKLYDFAEKETCR